MSLEVKKIQRERQGIPNKPRSLRELATYRFLCGCTAKQILAIPENFWLRLTRGVVIDVWDIKFKYVKFGLLELAEESGDDEELNGYLLAIRCKDIYRFFKEGYWVNIIKLEYSPNAAFY